MDNPILIVAICMGKSIFPESRENPLYKQDSHTTLQDTYNVFKEEQFDEIILNLDQWFRRCLLKIFLIWSSGGPFVHRSRTIFAISVEAIMRNIFVNLFRIWVRRRFRLKDFFSRALAALLFSGVHQLMQF